MVTASSMGNASTALNTASGVASMIPGGQPAALALMAAGVGLGAIGDIQRGKEQKRAAERQQSILDSLMSEYETKMAPYRAKLEQQASKDISGALTPEDRALREQYRQLQQNQLQISSAKARENMMKAFAPYQTQYGPRAQRQQMESDRAFGEQEYSANLAYAQGLQNLQEQRIGRGLQTYGTLANMAGEQMRLKAGMQSQIPTDVSSGWSAALGGVGSAMAGLGASALTSAQMKNIFSTVPQAQLPQTIVPTGAAQVAAKPLYSFTGEGTAEPSSGLSDSQIIADARQAAVTGMGSALPSTMIPAMPTSSNEFAKSPQFVQNREFGMTTSVGEGMNRMGIALGNAAATPSIPTEFSISSTSRKPYDFMPMLGSGGF